MLKKLSLLPLFILLLSITLAHLSLNQLNHSPETGFFSNASQSRNTLQKNPVSPAQPAQPTSAGALSLLTITPAPRTVGIPLNAPFHLTFDQPLNPATIDATTVQLFGRWSGSMPGSWTLTNNNQTLIWQGERPFSAGEQIMLLIANSLESDGGANLRAGGYTFQFWSAVRRTIPTWQEGQTLDVRTQAHINTRAYGGVATDFNEDGWLDLTIINEDTADLRIFLNQADGEGQFDPFLTPPTPVNERASPNDVADFNADGHADMVVANIDTDSLSILLGNGDGTFQPQTEITVGDAPRGVAVLDFDGDGDIDIVNTNSGGGSLSLLTNNGAGSFSPPTYMNSITFSPWGLAAADMNEDGLLDLVIGHSNGNSIIRIALANGDGTFTLGNAQAAGGNVWMLNTGDVNGDGHDDVIVANGSNNNGAIILGDGTGQLGSPTIHALDPLPIATDLGDFDGDGDLDWITSSYLGDWLLFTNDSHGSFTFDQRFTAPIAASCALFFDHDNDGDLDLALIDELADVVIIQTNENEELFLPTIIK